MASVQDAAVVAYREAYDKTISTGQRLDIVFNQIRIGRKLYDILIYVVIGT